MQSLRSIISSKALFKSTSSFLCTTTPSISYSSHFTRTTLLSSTIPVQSKPIQFFSTISDSNNEETGVVKFYVARQSYGFILADSDGKELFVHRTDIKGAPADDARNPILKLGEKVKFIRVEKKEEGNGNGDNVKLAAKDVVFANGENVPVFRQGHLKERSKVIKGKLGDTVYNILSQGGDEEKMAQEIADAYTLAKIQIDRLKMKIERESSSSSSSTSTNEQ